MYVGLIWTDMLDWYGPITPDGYHIRPKFILNPFCSFTQCNLQMECPNCSCTNMHIFANNGMDCCSITLHCLDLRGPVRSLNLLEPSGPVQACNGIGLPFFHGKFLSKRVQTQPFWFSIPFVRDVVCMLDWYGPIRWTDMDRYVGTDMDRYVGLIWTDMLDWWVPYSTQIYSKSVL
jgi:hypothetical protein